MTLLDRGTGPHPEGTQIQVRKIQTVMAIGEAEAVPRHRNLAIFDTSPNP
jgi:hypothetical protein